MGWIWRAPRRKLAQLLGALPRFSAQHLGKGGRVLSWTCKRDKTNLKVKNHPECDGQLGNLMCLFLKAHKRGLHALSAPLKSAEYSFFYNLNCKITNQFEITIRGVFFKLIDQSIVSLLFSIIPPTLCNGRLKVQYVNSAIGQDRALNRWRTCY